MSNEDAILKSVAAATPKIVQLLAPLSPEGRKRALASAMAIFGEVPPSLKSSEELEKHTDSQNSAPAGSNISQKAMSWMKKNSITRDQLDHVFSIEQENIDIIASNMPGENKRQQVVEAYIIAGVAAFLRTGEVGFADSDGRALCVKVGAYDLTNHARHIKAFGNLITGSKSSGWKLTNPGLAEGANIVRKLAPQSTS